jgi:hypothetical protein
MGAANPNRHLAEAGIVVAAVGKHLLAEMNHFVRHGLKHRDGMAIQGAAHPDEVDAILKTVIGAVLCRQR